MDRGAKERLPTKRLGCVAVPPLSVESRHLALHYAAMHRLLRVVELNAPEFCARTGPLLALREVENGLPYGIALRLANTATHESPALLLAVENSHEVVAACVWTPPNEVVVTRLPEGAAELIAAHCLTKGWPVAGVLGPWDQGREVAAALARLTSGTVKVRKRQRVLALEAVMDVVRANGGMRLADVRDSALLADWYLRFAQETNLPVHQEALTWAQRVINSGSAFLWADGDDVVSLACWSRETPRGRSIAPVYTPPNARGRGYATSLVAELSQRILTSGKRFATLFTDAANPTSNHIYETIGYRMVCEYDAYSVNART